MLLVYSRNCMFSFGVFGNTNTWVLKRCTVTPNVYRSSVRNCVPVIPLSPRILRRHLDFCEIVLWTCLWKLGPFHGLLQTSRWCGLAFTPCVTPGTQLLVQIVTPTCHSNITVMPVYSRTVHTRGECELNSPVYCSVCLYLVLINCVRLLFSPFTFFTLPFSLLTWLSFLLGGMAVRKVQRNEMLPLCRAMCFGMALVIPYGVKARITRTHQRNTELSVSKSGYFRN